ncbi:sister chromatid cohesion protein 1 [Kappamyces sp. JEL0829]|nr:sister chromatid cohesion protein 1 [Kappamyces sp. JEL0829]
MGFYSENILAKRGPLAKVWLAAHWERKLSKSQFLQTNIPTSISAIVDDYGQPMALRLSGQLLLGVARIFSRKTRYLLEDCSEALVKIKMAFRPGVVDLTAEQAIANSGAITVSESLNQFDILVSDPMLDLKKADTSLQPEYLSFSQQLAERLDENLDLDFSVEVGRDPMLGREFTPGFDTSSVREKSVALEDPLLGNDPSFDLGVGNDMAGELNFDADLGPMDFDLGPDPADPARDFQMAPMDFDTTAKDADMPLKDDSGTFVVDGVSFGYELDAGPIRVRRHRRKTTPKKRKALVDETIELSTDYLRDQLQNTRDISGHEVHVPSTRFIQDCLEAEKLGLHYFEDLDPAQQYPGLEGYRIARPRTKQQRLLSEFARLRVSDGKGDDSLHIRGRVGQLTELDDTFQFNDDYGDAADFQIPPAAEPEQLDPSTVLSHQYVGEEEFDENIVLPDQAQDDMPFVFEAFDQDNLTTSVQDDNLNISAKKTLQLLQERQSELNQESFYFRQLAESITRSNAAKLFFEVLVLKSKDLVQVSQSAAFGDIAISLKTT